MRLRLLAALLGGLIASTAHAALDHAFIAFHEAPTASIARELELNGVVSGRIMPTINAIAVSAPREVLELYARDPRVKAVTLQRRLQWHLYSSRPQIAADGLDQPYVAADETELSRPAVTGKGVTIAVIDSGIFMGHPDFGAPGASRVLGGYNFELSLAQREAGVFSAEQWDVYAEVSGYSALLDEVGHGTHCAGIMASDGTSASGLDIRGMAPEANLVALKIASAGNGVVEDVGFEANAVAAIDYMIRHREELGNVRVAGNSWGILQEEAQGLLGPTDFDPLAEVVRAAVDAGIVMVFSAGNDGPEPETVRPIPNGMDEVISVASACKADRGGCAPGAVNRFSSRGASVDIAAPGDQIISTSSPSILEPIGQTLEGDYFGDTAQDELQNRVAYARLSGTSMASPHVTGVVALMFEANPDLTPAQVREILIASADDMVVEGDPELTPGFDHASGHGLVNARRAVAMAAHYGENATAPAGRAAPVSSGGAASPLWLLLICTLLPAIRRRTPRR